MLKVGDTVKVISTTLCGDEMKELIPIGTICTVTEVCMSKNTYYGITPKDRNDNYYFYYLESELEKGELVWIPEKKDSDNSDMNKEYRIDIFVNKVHSSYYFNTKQKAVDFAKKHVKNSNDVFLLKHLIDKKYEVVKRIK